MDQIIVERRIFSPTRDFLSGAPRHRQLLPGNWPDGMNRLARRAWVSIRRRQARHAQCAR